MKRTEITKEVFEALRTSKADVKLEREETFWLITPGSNVDIRLEDSKTTSERVNPAKVKARATSLRPRTPTSLLYPGPRWSQRDTAIKKGSKAHTAALQIAKLFALQDTKPPGESNKGKPLKNSYAVAYLAKSFSNNGEDEATSKQRATSAISYLCFHDFICYE